MEDSKPLSSPGAAVEKPSPNERAEEEAMLGKDESRIYRRAAARLNYMSLDRADLSYSAKEAARGMARPTAGDVIRLKRILRYLKGSPKIVNLFEWQEPQKKIMGYSDSDWAGCTKTRKSTSGGFLMMGKHMLAHWSSTQSVVALSSAEAELNALIKIASEALGIRNTLLEMEVVMEIEIKTDSSAAKGIVHREGCGKVKHLEARQLWLQEHVGNKTISVTKVPRDVNYSDVLTHNWNARDGYRHLTSVSIVWR